MLENAKDRGKLKGKVYQTRQAESKTSEAYLLQVLTAMIDALPFVIRGFHFGLAIFVGAARSHADHDDYAGIRR